MLDMLFEIELSVDMWVFPVHQLQIDLGLKMHPVMGYV